MTLMHRCEVCGICYASERAPMRVRVVVCPDCAAGIARHESKRSLLDVLRRFVSRGP